MGRVEVSNARAIELVDGVRRMFREHGHHAVPVGAVVLGAQCPQVELVVDAPAPVILSVLGAAPAWLSVHRVERNGCVVVSASTQQMEDVWLYEFAGHPEASWGLRTLVLSMPTRMRQYLRQRLLAHGWQVDFRSSVVVDRWNGCVHVCPTEESVFELAAVDPLPPAQRAEWSVHWRAETS